MKDPIELLLDMLHITTGRMGADTREKIWRCLDDPAIETWDDIHLFVLTAEPFVNFLAAVQAVDPSFPVPEKQPDGRGWYYRPWTRVPTREVLVDALKYAAFRQKP